MVMGGLDIMNWAETNLYGLSVQSVHAPLAHRRGLLFIAQILLG